MTGITVFAATFFLVVSCSSGGNSDQSAESKPEQESHLSPEREKALRTSGVLMPGKKVKVDPAEAKASEERARQLEGSRAQFGAIHDNGVTLMPVSASLALADQVNEREANEVLEQVVTSTLILPTTTLPTPTTLPTTTLPTTEVTATLVPDTTVATTSVTLTTKPGDDCPAPEKVCAEACATATATAYAFAFAHASATACAWAEAWACVYSFEPFGSVCSWASSSACSTAFATAFGFGFGFDTQTVCAKQCSGD